MYRYTRGGIDEPHVIIKKKSGDAKFIIQFASKCEKNDNAGIVLVQKYQDKWYRVNYEGQFGLPGPIQQK